MSSCCSMVIFCLHAILAAAAFNSPRCALSLSSACQIDPEMPMLPVASI